MVVRKHGWWKIKGNTPRQTHEGWNKWERTRLRGGIWGRRGKGRKIQIKRDGDRMRERELGKKSNRKRRRWRELGRGEAEWAMSRRGTVLQSSPWCGLDGSKTRQQLTHTPVSCIHTRNRKLYRFPPLTHQWPSACKSFSKCADSDDLIATFRMLRRSLGGFFVSLNCLWWYLRSGHIHSRPKGIMSPRSLCLHGRNDVSVYSTYAALTRDCFTWWKRWKHFNRVCHRH